MPGPIFTTMGPLGLPYTTPPAAAAMTADEIREFIAEERGKAQRGEPAKTIIIEFKDEAGGKKSVMLTPEELARCKLHGDKLRFQKQILDKWEAEVIVAFGDIKRVKTIV